MIAVLGNAPAVLLLGIVVGLQYGLLALGIVLVHKANRFVNFAHGHLGILAAALLGTLVLEHGWPYWVALPAALALGGLVGAVVERVVVQRLFDQSRLTLMLATIGVAQLLFVAGATGPLKVDGALLVEHGYPLPFDVSITVGPIVLIGSQVLTLIVAPLLAVGLGLFFSRSAMGKAIRASASNADAARLAGISVRRVSMVVWITAGVLSALTAVLLAPTQPTLDVAALGPGLLLRGIAAALVGGLTSLPVAFVAGVGLGVIEQAAFWNWSQGGTTDLAVLAVVLVTIVVRAKTLSAAGRGETVGTTTARSPLVAALWPGVRARRIDRLGWTAMAALGAVLPLLPGLRTQEKAVLLTFVLCYALVALSLTSLTGWAGQVSIGHFAILGIGAYAAAKAGEAGWALPAVIVASGLVGTVAALVVGLPALRFRGLVLAASTLAFALAAPSWLFRQSWVSEGSTGNAAYLDVRLPGVGALETPRAIYYVALVVVVLAVLTLRALRASGVGRVIVAVRDDERTAAAHGHSPTAAKLTALGVSGFLAGAAGALWAASQQTWSFQAFPASLSVVMLAAAIVGGLGTLHGPLLGTLAVWAWPYLVPDANTLVIRAVSSGALLLVVLLVLPGGLASLVERLRARLLRGHDEDAGAAPSVAVPVAPVDQVDAVDVPLRTHSVRVTFGGVVAVADVSLDVRDGEIVGLIGGNGAGKSTFMACVSGHLDPGGGHITLFDHEVTGEPAHRRAAAGLARSFQDAHLYPGLSLLETVMVAIDRTDRSDPLSALVGAPWVAAAEERKRALALRALQRVGLADRWYEPVGALSTGMRRLCDLACVLAARPRLVLLDEPTAGIAQREVEAFGDLIRSLRDDEGCAVLLVEHDMPLLMSLCDRVVAMESGRVIADGPPAEVQADRGVIASYLGTDPDAIQRSGPGARSATGAAPAAGSGRGSTKGRRR